MEAPLLGRHPEDPLCIMMVSDFFYPNCGELCMGCTSFCQTAGCQLDGQIASLKTYACMLAFTGISGWLNKARRALKQVAKPTAHAMTHQSDQQPHQQRQTVQEWSNSSRCHKNESIWHACDWNNSNSCHAHMESKAMHGRVKDALSCGFMHATPSYPF